MNYTYNSHWSLRSKENTKHLPKLNCRRANWDQILWIFMCWISELKDYLVWESKLHKLWMIEKFRINASDPYEIQILAPLYDYFQWQDLFSPTCPLVAVSSNLTSTKYWGQKRQVFGCWGKYRFRAVGWSTKAVLSQRNRAGGIVHNVQAK